MASIFADFNKGQTIGSGPLLAASLTPISPPDYPDRLRSFYYASDASSVPSDLRYSLFQARNLKLPKQEQNTWVDIFSAFWKAAGEILKVDSSPQRGSWDATFEAWKNVANTLIRGYSTGSLQAWTLPCLYVVGKYLRIFATKADTELATQGSASFGNRFQDDLVADSDNPKQEEAARIINRMFTLCLNDRYDGRVHLGLSVTEYMDQGTD